MSLIPEPIQQYFRNKKMNTALKEQAGTKKLKVNWEKAKSIGLLFDATQLDKRQAALKYVDQLRSKKKKVKVLAYFDAKQHKEASFDFPFFDKSNLDWMNCPKGEQVDFFLSQKFDIFTFLNPTTSVYSEYIAALSNAHLKIGPISKQLDCYDLMLNVKDKMNLNPFIQHLEFNLQKTNIEYEAA